MKEVNTELVYSTFFFHVIRSIENNNLSKHLSSIDTLKEKSMSKYLQ